MNPLTDLIPRSLIYFPHLRNTTRSAGRTSKRWKSHAAVGRSLPSRPSGVRPRLLEMFQAPPAVFRFSRASQIPCCCPVVHGTLRSPLRPAIRYWRGVENRFHGVSRTNTAPKGSIESLRAVSEVWFASSGPSVSSVGGRVGALWKMAADNADDADDGKRGLGSCVAAWAPFRPETLSVYPRRTKFRQLQETPSRRSRWTRRTPITLPRGGCQAHISAVMCGS